MNRRFHIPFEGKLWLGMAICFAFIGWFKGLNLILLLAYFMLLLWLLNFLLAGRGLKKLEVRRRIERPAFAGAPFHLEIELHNPEATERIGILLLDKGTSHRVAHFQVRLGPQETVRIRRPITVPARCCYYFEPVVVSSGLPFGLVHRGLAIGPDEQVPVFPKLGRLHLGRLRHFLRRSAASLGWARASLRPQPLLATEFHGLRPFRSGDSPRWIHWRTSARRGELMVREFEQGWTEDLTVVLEPWLPQYLTSDGGKVIEAEPFSGAARQLLEDAISLTATLCWEWCQRPGGRMTLAIAGFGPIVVAGAAGPDLADQMLECLAVQQGSPVTNTSKLFDRLAETRLPDGPVLVISTRTASELPEELAGHLRRPVASLVGPELGEVDFYERPRRETKPSKVHSGPSVAERKQA